MRQRRRFDLFTLLLWALMLAVTAFMGLLFIRPIWDPTAWL